MTRLDPQRVEAILRDCLFNEGEPTEPRVEVEGVLNRFGFHPGRLESHREEIGALLAELPDSFHADKGGGMSFLNACEDRHGTLWTGMQPTVDHLLVLGIATGQAKWCLPRAMWSALPGGMPYVVVGLPREGGLAVEDQRPKPGDQCDDTCTVDCGHCKGGRLR